MMVNEFKNNALPWQSTVPQQMPWMSSYDPNYFAMQFGQQQQQQSLPVGAMPTTNTISPTVQQLMQPASLVAYQQHPSPMINFPIATTLTTSPVTACPTSSASNTLFAHGPNLQAVQSGITTTTQSYSQTTMFPTMPTHIQPNFAVSQPFDPQQSLIHIPNPSHDRITHQKRSSVELEEDEQMRAQQPPTKQVLSERKLFKKFGSLHLDRNSGSPNSSNSDSDDFGEDELSKSTEVCQQKDRKEFDRYVYLLFKDKKEVTTNFSTNNNSTFDRLVRDERDKLSKAVVLWSPPLKNSFLNPRVDGDNDDDDDEDEEFRYKDHRDFLKNCRRAEDDDSVIITEITDEEARIMTSNQCDTDDLMLE